jgi:hypothetical protein
MHCFLVVCCYKVVVLLNKCCLCQKCNDSRMLNMLFS